VSARATITPAGAISSGLALWARAGLAAIAGRPVGPPQKRSRLGLGFVVSASEHGRATVRNLKPKVDFSGYRPHHYLQIGKYANFTNEGDIPANLGFAEAVSFVVQSGRNGLFRS
jgi:hypothetical protein